MSQQSSLVKALPALMVIALLCMSVGGALFLWQRAQGYTDEGSQPLHAVAALAQELSLHATAAVGGQDSAFVALTVAREGFEQLSNSHAQLVDRNMSAALLQQAQRVLQGRDALLAAKATAAQLDKDIPQLLQHLGDLAGSFAPEQVENAKQQLRRFELTALGIQQDVNALATGTIVNESRSSATAQHIIEGVDYLGQVISELGGEGQSLALPRASGTEAERNLKTISSSYRAVATRARAAASAAATLQQTYAASRALVTQTSDLYAALAQAAKTEKPVVVGPAYTVPLALLLAALLALAALSMIYALTAKDRQAAENQRVKSKRDQVAILRLLDEISSLSDGDLTVQATVGEDITGAIADAINSAIETLRELVTTINTTALTVDAGCRQALATVGHLAKASVAQSKQVVAASESVVAMAASIEEVSGNAERSADVARHSVDIAHKGNDAVRRTIDGMNTIRETIQDTSKRIKRLGESSQEIGNIVELINDIAEQTNILALNASIQASMAGEAGRGFAVVADEVQHLAERAANATKQIEALVRTIQADTNDAVVSMERSTTDVVGGALLAENAGAALEEIELVSNQIASLVQNISSSARQQSQAAQDIARNMQTLREISAQTAENSSATSGSVGKLAQLSAQLRESVMGFRLPQQPDDSAMASLAGGNKIAEPPALKTVVTKSPSALAG